MKKIFSFVLKTDGFYGKSFAMAATVRMNKQEVARFEGKLPDSTVSDSFTKLSILPALRDMKVSHQNSYELEEAFWVFYKKHCLVKKEQGLFFDKKDVQVIAHLGSLAESGYFHRAVERDKSRIGQAPIPLHEVGTLLEAFGENVTSLDSYVKKQGLHIPFSGISHQALHASIVAAVIWEHLIADIANSKSDAIFARAITEGIATNLQKRAR